MSVEAITWALSQPVARSSAKFVLVALANCANSDMECWPSVGYLCGATAQDRKTVLENMKRLVALGVIKATDERRGATRQVVVYRLLTEVTPALVNSTKVGTVASKKPENGTLRTVPKTEAKSPVFPPKESRFSAITGPKTGHGTVKEPSVEPSGKQIQREVSRPELLADGLDGDLADAWIAHRRAKKAKLTPIAWAGVKREATTAGWGVPDAVRKAIERNWTGFDASWVAGTQSGRGTIRKGDAVMAGNIAAIQRYEERQQ